MSTRAEIYFVNEGEKEPEVAMYQWGDGNPASVLESLYYLKHMLRKTRSERNASSVAANYIFFEKLRRLHFYGRPVVEAMAKGEFPDVIQALSNLEKQPSVFFSYYPHSIDKDWNQPYKQIGAHYVFYVIIPYFDLGMEDYEQAPDWRVQIYDVSYERELFAGSLEQAIELRNKFFEEDRDEEFSDFLVRQKVPLDDVIDNFLSRYGDKVAAKLMFDAPTLNKDVEADILNYVKQALGKEYETWSDFGHDYDVHGEVVNWLKEKLNGLKTEHWFKQWMKEQWLFIS